VLDGALQGGSMIAVALANDRDQKLARDISAHHERIRLVELPGVDELAVGALRAVNVGGEEQAGHLLGLLLAQERHRGPPIETGCVL
jgi:hypothetical protein